ncbi:putative phage tail protein [Sphingomonas sp. S-NIH.Pt15_0812]|uniref:YmfQ family protein n=1 Tax=Sphingomonas sp. S-NIH.Pt15_0812 TaxID=1920129 RepID=UPI000F7FA2B3|nr:putative phage tail protein [Sphingomonas sp. S-NIH.Pt15_0812]RSU46352.1 phage tail protein [Sphingomonas sp. S-NIH.Pt15_0812]
MRYDEPVFGADPGYDGEPVLNPPETGPAPISSPAPPQAAEPTRYAGGIYIPAAPPTPRAAPTHLPVPVVTRPPRYRAGDYATAARALLPRGRAWSTDPDSVQGRVLAAIGEGFARSDAAATTLLAGTLPGAETAMLPEWEATLGLPDPALGDAPTIAQRLDQVRGRFVGIGGQSRGAIIAFAAALGFTIRITNFAPFRAGLSTVGNPVASDAWSFVWGVTVTATTGALPIAALMRELDAIKPAETTVILLT